MWGVTRAKPPKSPWLDMSPMPMGRRPIRTIALPAASDYARQVRAYVLVELGDSEAFYVESLRSS
jgi:hypothetical protein